MYTKSDLVSQIKKGSDGIMGTHLPMLSKHFHDFSEDIGLNQDTFYHISKYIFNVDYAAKRQLFETIGFKVLYMTTSAMKVSRFATDDKNQIDQDFLDGKRNVFIFEVESDMKFLYFILEYDVAGDPLADYTIDRAELAREMARKAAAKNWMNAIRAKREAREATGETNSNSMFG